VAKHVDTLLPKNTTLKHIETDDDHLLDNIENYQRLIGSGIQINNNCNLKLRAYADSDWARCPATRKSISGYCVFLGDSLVTWKSKKQSTLSRSSAEAEYKSMVSATCEVIWLSTLLGDMGVKGLLLVVMYCDNSSTLQIAANLVFHEKSKHFEIDVHLIVDVLTKALDTKQHKILCAKIGLLDMFKVEKLDGAFEETYYDTVDEAIDMYMKYAKMGGFEVKKSGQRLTKLGAVKHKYIMCNREGVPKGMLLHEDTKSYAWLLKAFMTAFLKEPTMIVTYQDGAMKRAIESVLTKAKHRLCMWHIMQRIPSNICKEIYDKTDFKEHFDKIVWNMFIEPLKFEEKWARLIEDFGLQNHKWMTKMFNLREIWIPAYFIDSLLFGLMRTTSRSKSENSFFKSFTSPGATLISFLMSYELAMERQRYRQEALDFKTIDAAPKCDTKLAIERHAARVYTRTIFLLVQMEIIEGIALGPGYEVGESSSAAAARPARGLRADYGFVATMDREIKRDLEREVGYGITDLWDEIVETLQGAPVSTDTELGRHVTAFETRVRHDTDERQRLDCPERRSMDASDLARGEVMSLRTTILGQMSEIRELHDADRMRQVVTSEMLKTDHRRSAEMRELRTADRTQQ
ncbi:FAR1-related sequence 5-like protein, partial [Tanacetum coccineum]